MKNIINRIALALLITALASVSVFAKTKRATVSFPANIKVNGTLVKKGVYELKFDDKTGELAVMDGKKVVARATTSAAKRDRKAKTLEVRSFRSGDELELTGIAFSGSDQILMINGSQASR